MTVLAPQQLVKQPAESRLFSMEFKNLLATGETISTVVSVLATPSGLTISGETISGTEVQFRIAGGADAQIYRVETTITTNQANTLEGDGLLVVRDS